MLNDLWGGRRGVKCKSAASPNTTHSYQKLNGQQCNCRPSSQSRVDKNLLNRNILFIEGICQRPPQNIGIRDALSWVEEGYAQLRKTGNFSGKDQKRKWFRFKNYPIKPTFVIEAKIGPLFFSYLCTCQAAPNRVEWKKQ